jgi:D-alanine-D-alanine ligase-like ATP-grasp enzyme
MKKSARHKKESVVLGKILQKIAPEIGAKVFIEPTWEIAGQIIFKNGKHSYFKYNTLDLNPVGSSDISKDKDYANFFMHSMGYRIIPGSKTFFSKRWGEAIGMPKRNIDAAYNHALKLGFPVVVKPNSGSQGSGVALVHTKHDFYKAVREIFKRDTIVLVQKQIHGKDYRLVVLDDVVISAYERIPLSVVGDGKHTVKQLLNKKQNEFIASSRDTKIKIDDPRILIKLKRQNFNFDSIPSTNERIFLLDNANLSSGGDSIDVTKKVHPMFEKLAIQLTHDMGLRLCGVDIMINGDISEQTEEYWILEINAAPGLDHYVKMGTDQEKIVENLYRKVLEHMEK